MAKMMAFLMQSSRFLSGDAPEYHSRVGLGSHPEYWAYLTENLTMAG
jgi:hypothetical protein